MKRSRASFAAVVGWVDGPRLGQIRGWAMDVVAPASRLTVEAVGECDEPIASALADRYRADVHKAGYGDGHYGFAMRLDNLRPIGKIRFLCGQLRTELPRSATGRDNQGVMTFERAGFVLRLDHLPAPPFLSGWAFDRYDPEQRRQLRLRAGRQLLAEQRATLFRPDSIEQGRDGFHGFSLPLPTKIRDLFVEDVASGLKFRVS